jgi:hypothetical protein
VERRQQQIKLCVGIMPAMVKTLIILVLLVVVAGGAALSRPTPADFKGYLKSHAEASQTNIVGRVAADVYADQYVKNCDFKNRLLWTTVEHGGQPAYVGAFNHWWESSAAKK